MKKVGKKRDLYGGSKLQVDDTLSRSQKREGDVFKTGDNLTINIDKIHPAENNPRKLNIDDSIIQQFADCASDVERENVLLSYKQDAELYKKLVGLFELGSSIRNTSLISPIVLRKASLSGADRHRIDQIKPGDYVIISGERRWTAHRMFNITQASCLIRTEDEDGALAIRIEENLHREDLSREEYLNSIVMLKELDPSYGKKELMAGIGLGERMARRVNNIVNCYISDSNFKSVALNTSLHMYQLEKIALLSTQERDVVCKSLLQGASFDKAFSGFGPEKKDKTKSKQQPNTASKINFKLVQSSEQMRKILLKLQPNMEHTIRNLDLSNEKETKKIWESVLSTVLEELDS